jgi:hypothetical protein
MRKLGLINFKKNLQLNTRPIKLSRSRQIVFYWVVGAQSAQFLGTSLYKASKVGSTT